MAQPVNPQALQQLESDLAAAQKRGDHLEALDILEDLSHRGWASARHYFLMGNCYLEVRQRQDAKRCWLKAFDLDPNLNGLQQGLDKQFPGWEKEAAAAPQRGNRHGEEEAP